MEKRLEGKVAIVTGAGQTPGFTIGNGRAISILYARHGAKVMLVDINLESALETQAMITEEGGDSFAFAADVTSSSDCQRIAEECLARYGRIDILVNNVGTGETQAGPVQLSEEAWDRVFRINLKSVFLTCKYVLPIMEKQGSGSVINISSIAATCASRLIAYKSSKAGVNALTHILGYTYASKGIRVNAIMPGLMNTPMAIEGYVKGMGADREKLIQERDSKVPLGGKMGTAWDTAYAALFFASDESRFITAAILPVDGGQSARIG
ncbi:MAG: SDR family NAD(P)-dependent oxidoreductase [Syntrophomonadales bacterium]